MAAAVELSRVRALVPRAVEAAPTRWQRLPPPVIALALTLAALGLHALVVGAPLARSLPAGVALALAGFGWSAWALLALRRAGNPLPPLARPLRLVDSGPYRFGRNPLYLGIAAMMLGAGIAAGVPLMAAAAGGFVVIVARVHVALEEAMLRRAFGGWYSDYAASVRRWI